MRIYITIISSSKRGRKRQKGKSGQGTSWKLLVRPLCAPGGVTGVGAPQVTGGVNDETRKVIWVRHGLVWLLCGCLALRVVFC